MNQEITIGIHDVQLKDKKFHQVSFVHPLARRRVRKTFRVKGAAEKYAELVKSQFLANGLNATSMVEISVLLKMFLESNQKSTMRRLPLPVFMSFIETFGNVPAMNVTTKGLVEWIDRTKEERNYTDSTVENLKAYLGKFFDFLIETKVIRMNPLAQVVIKRVRTKDHHTKLKEHEIKDLLDRVERVSPKAVFPKCYLQAHTAARLGEIRNLKWSQVNFENGTIHFLKTKNSEDRLIQMSPQVAEFLSKLPRVSDHVVTYLDGQPWRPPQYRKQFQNVRAEVAFPKHWTNHGFRHSFAFNYLRQGGDMRQLQYMLGHKKLEMTVELYGKITAEDVGAGSPFDF